MSLVCPVVCLPNGVVFALVVILTARAYIAAGLVWLTLYREVTVAEIFAASNEKEFAALLAVVW